MKKLLTVAMSLFFCGGMALHAQVPAPQKKDAPKQDVKNENVPVEQKAGSTDSKRTSAGPEWFTPSEAVRAFNGGATSGYSYTTIFPDTNALFTYTGSSGDVTYENNINSVGIVFDPRSVIYDGSPFKTTNWSNYTVDSLRFVFFYRRFNADTNIVDTLVVTTFDKTSLSRGFSTIYAGAVDYTTDRYRATGTNAVVHTILLTKDDTSSSSQERVIAVNQTVSGAAGTGFNWFGATISYLPGYKGYNHGLPFDTVANFVSNVVDSTRVNTVRLLGYYDPSQYVESTTIPPIGGTRIYNHGIVAEPTQRYKLNSTVNYYYPAFYSTVNLFPYIEFKVQSPNVSVNSISNASISSIYPNPANGGDVMVEMNSDINTNAVVTVTDITGKVVKTMEVALENGTNEISLNVDGLTKGMYVISVKAEGVNSVSKLTIE